MGHGSNHVQDDVTERRALLQPVDGEEHAAFEDTAIAHVIDDEIHWLQRVFMPGGIVTSVFTLCAMSLGVGVFVLPAVFKSIGLVAGIVSIVVFACWSYWLQIVMIRVAKAYDVSSYEDLADASLGHVGRYALALFTAITNLLANSAHMATAVKLLHSDMELYVTNGYGANTMTKVKQLILYVPLMIFALFLCSGAKVSDLRFVSSASVTIVLTLCLWTTGECMFWYWPGGRSAFSGPNRVILASDNWEDYATDLPAVAFAFTSTFMLFPVYKEMNDQSLKSMKKTVAASTWVCAAGYMILAVIGVLTFGNEVDENIVTHKPSSLYIYTFPSNHYVIVFLSFFLAIALTMLYAIINFPFILSVETLLELVPIKADNGPLLPTKLRHVIITVVGMVILVAMNLSFGNSLLTLFGLCGGWGVVFIVYAIPSCIALAAGHRADPVDSDRFEDKALSVSSIFHRILLVLSLIVVMIIAISYTYVTFK
eukprot:m.20292 g.20292  ORF g.20292 m.20292 type:complete len:483 (+) comp3778_c0_seq1:139-1587(+)